MTISEASSPYLSPKQVADLIGKSPDWVRKRAADGTLPYRKVGRDLRFIRKEIEAWVDGQTGHH